MKTAWVTVMMMTLAATGAEAVDIDGKWGIGAGTFSNGGGGEVSLIRGTSARSAWLFDVGAEGSDQTVTATGPTQPGETMNSNQLFLRLGPGYRRFVRPTEEFSPYWDLHVRGTFSRTHAGGSGTAGTQKVAGAGAEFSFGLEYFTRWHFSVAAHTALVTANWLHVTAEQTSDPVELSGNFTRLSIGLSPALFVRGYF